LKDVCSLDTLPGRRELDQNALLVDALVFVQLYDSQHSPRS
jgi:hypothetical protein